jgi:hypothetical protein
MGRPTHPRRDRTPTRAPQPRRRFKGKMGKTRASQGRSVRLGRAWRNHGSIERTPAVVRVAPSNASAALRASQVRTPSTPDTRCIPCPASQAGRCHLYRSQPSSQPTPPKVRASTATPDPVCAARASARSKPLAVLPPSARCHRARACGQLGSSEDGTARRRSASSAPLTCTRPLFVAWQDAACGLQRFRERRARAAVNAHALRRRGRAGQLNRSHLRSCHRVDSSPHPGRARLERIRGQAVVAERAAAARRDECDDCRGAARDGRPGRRARCRAGLLRHPFGA